jgi:hypothetical protein
VQENVQSQFNSQLHSEKRLSSPVRSFHNKTRPSISKKIGDHTVKLRDLSEEENETYNKEFIENYNRKYYQTQGNQFTSSK